MAILCADLLGMSIVKLNTATRPSTGPHSAVGSEPNRRSRGHEFDPNQVPYLLEIDYDHEIISRVILLLPLIQDGLLSVTSESMCLVKHAEEKILVR